GWLILLAFGIITTPLRNIASFCTTSAAALSLARWRALTTPELDTYAPGVAVMIVVETLFQAAFSAYGIAVAALFFQKRRSFPLHFSIYALGMVAFQLFDHFTVQAVSKDAPANMLPVLQVMIWAGIWVTYVWRSRRVAATFVATRTPTPVMGK